MIGRALAVLDYPMAIVTAARSGEHSGCLVGFFTECSIKPMRWLVCVSKTNHTFGIASASVALVLHFLHDDQFDLATLFGHETDDAVDKFARCSWRTGPYGLRVIAGCDWIAGPIIDRFDFGDHVGQVLDVRDGDHEHPDGPQLGFQRARTIGAGHAP